MSRSLELSPVLLLAAASTMLGLSTARGSFGPDTELMLHEVGQPRGPIWDTAFVNHAGYWSHYAHDAGCSSWPLPPSNDCNDWARFAESRGVLAAGAPKTGDLFVLWSKRQRRFVHVGIVASSRNETGILPNGTSFTECDTIEGNVDAAGRWPRSGIHRQTRRLAPEKGDRFIRWFELGQHDETRATATAAYATPGEVCRALMMRDVMLRAA